MKQISMEEFLEKMEVDVYPITLIKFLLNKKRILSYFSKAANPDNNEIRYVYKIDTSDCKNCESKKDDGVLCRQHTSIDRVLNSTVVAYDSDTNVYFYKNEIFRKVGERLVIVYCPHPKLISGPITDSKVRKVNPITIEDSNLPKELKFDKVKGFISSELLDNYMRCWFDNEFSIVTIPKDRNGSDWCLVANKK